MPHILIVDDDKEIRELLAQTLSQFGFESHVAADGLAMFEHLKNHSPDLIVLDLMLPGDNGLELCKKLNGRIPVIMLTAMGTEMDRIIGLEVGADDYLPKPFNPRELVARIKAILRRSQEPSTTLPTHTTRFCFTQWTLNTLGRQLLDNEQTEISLSASEYDLLLVFCQNPQRVLSRDELLDGTKNRALSPFDRSIDVQISRLRHKIEIDAKKPSLIKTIRGGGYLFTADVSTA